MKSRCLIFCLLLVLTACGGNLASEPTPTARPLLTSIDYRDIGILSLDSCGPPCLWGITPGVTTKQQALDILEDNPIDAQCEFVERVDLPHINYILCSNTRLSLIIDKETRVVAVIGMVVSGPLTVSDIIDAYGEPDQYYLDHQRVTMDLTSMALIYPEQNMVLFTVSQEGLSYEITSDTEIEIVQYESDTVLESDLDQAKPWEGYGVYGE